MSRRRSEQPIPLFPQSAAAAVSGPMATETVPPGHPLEFWEIEEAAARTKLSVSFLQASQCPRAKLGTRVVFCPVETVLWVRRHLSNRPSGAP